MAGAKDWEEGAVDLLLGVGARAPLFFFAEHSDLPKHMFFEKLLLFNSTCTITSSCFSKVACAEAAELLEGARRHGGGSKQGEWLFLGCRKGLQRIRDRAQYQYICIISMHIEQKVVNVDI